MNDGERLARIRKLMENCRTAIDGGLAYIPPFAEFDAPNLERLARQLDNASEWIKEARRLVYKTDKQE